MDSLPVACSLSPSELQERRLTVLQKFRRAVSEAQEIENGFIYRLPANGAVLKELADLVELEHKCCPFLRFTITVEPADGPVFLEISGLEGTKEFLAQTFSDSHP